MTNPEYSTPKLAMGDFERAGRVAIALQDVEGLVAGLKSPAAHKELGCIESALSYLLEIKLALVPLAEVLKAEAKERQKAQFDNPQPFIPPGTTFAGNLPTGDT